MKFTKKRISTCQHLKISDQNSSSDESKETTSGFQKISKTPLRFCFTVCAFNEKPFGMVLEIKLCIFLKKSNFNFGLEV